jgi:hypothetical protein
MQQIFLGLMMMALAFLGWAGCKSSPKETQSNGGTKKTAAQTNEVATPGGKSVVRIVNALNGRIISVKDELRFVIVDFPNQKLPRLEQKLSVYRADQKVAEIKVSGPYRGTTVAADITAGNVSYGDLVRDER